LKIIPTFLQLERSVYLLSIVNLKFLEADPGSTLSSADDIILAGNSQTTINSNAISNDEFDYQLTMPLFVVRVLRHCKMELAV